MTPPNDKEIDRDPTVVYPENSPPLKRAYRIFGPGHNELEELDKVKNDMFVSGIPEQGESWLTPLGQEIERNLGVGVAEILEAYTAYKNEIERMNSVDRMHVKRKEASSSGSEGKDEDGGGEWVVNVNANGKIRGEHHTWAEGEDPLEQFWKDPGLWLSRAEALARMQTMRSSIAETSATLREIERFYEQKMQPSKDLDQAVAKSVYLLQDLAVYAEKIEKVIRMHAGLSRGTTWESSDRPGVTFGPNVPWCIHRVYELDERIDAMKPVMAACERTRARLAPTKLLTVRKELRAELRLRLVRFAALCLPEEKRDGFKKGLEEELKQ